jgi:hypothetical protein
MVMVTILYSFIFAHICFYRKQPAEDVTMRDKNTSVTIIVVGYFNNQIFLRYI